MTTINEVVYTALNDGYGGTINEVIYRGMLTAVNGSPIYSPKIVTIGDSIMAGNVEITAGGGSTAEPSHSGMRGFVNWTQFLTGNPLTWRFQNWDGTQVGGNAFAVAGDSLVNILARLDNALKQNPDVLWAHFGTNDITAGESAATILDGYRWMIRRAAERNARVWIDTVLYRSTLTAPQELVRQAVNTGIRLLENEFKGRVLVFDYDAMTDSAYFSDGTHPNAAGAEWMARNVIIPKLGVFYGLQKVKRGLPDNYDATTSPMGNLLTNSDFTGTGGTIAGTGNSGTIPDSWSTAKTDGTVLAVAFSTSSLTDWDGETRNFVKMAMSSDGSGVDNETARFNPTSTITSNVVAGQWYTCECEVLVDDVLSGSNILRSVYIELRDNGTSGPITRSFNVGYSATGPVKEYFPTGGGQRRLLLRTFPFQARTASGLILRINVDADCTLTGSRVVYWGKPVVKPISFISDYGLAPQYVVATAGTTIYCRGGADSRLILNPAGTLATLTVVMPALPQNGDIQVITSSQMVTALTLTSGKTVNGAASALAANVPVAYQFNSTADKWFKIG